MSFASGKYSIAICSRCKMKKPYQELREDGNILGLYVCGDAGCYDHINPYKLPARQADAIALEHPRPDVSVAATQQYILSDNGLGIFIDQNGNPILP